MNKTFKSDVPMPPKIAVLPRDGRGYPIPANVLRKENGTAVFTANDAHWEWHALQQSLCAVTGTKMDDDDVWMICGPGSAFDPRGMINDLPVCGEAKDYAMKVCPYLATFRYQGLTPEQKARINLGPNRKGIDVTRDYTPMDRHIAARVNGFIITQSKEGGIMYLPNRLYEEVEVWVDGKRTQHTVGPDAVMKEHLTEGLANLLSAGISLADIPEYFLLALSGDIGGHFPWNRDMGDFPL